ncbi:C-CAP/cofactor C-like domain-containing protein [Mycena indigotica]|uniref:C-CAP/cofactor C-like domain-containing protein n=1 Tax=Mycena indigotica TaxID=2126181 RepID=A0A8H6S6F0_9AGAR|nr:C-CAP/cofactor C-like domain-containing protein [Mycena indigotica]KAF7292946.1 C-CAP/cofactor C-like domain-containing protein [Mycena indigotica]
MAETTWSFSQEFQIQFQTAHTQLTQRVDEAKSNLTTDGLSELSLDLAKLAKQLADATGSLPNYAQRQYELQVKSLEKSLEDLRGSVPKSKFSFKRKAPVTSSTSVAQSAPTPSLPPPEPATTNLTLSSYTRRYISHTSLPIDNAQTSDLAISDLNQCIVNLLSIPLKLSALHMRNLVDTVLLLPEIAGSVLLHDLRRCIVVVGCHQFRMHTSSLVDIHLSISSNPIIEHCSELRFSSYPATLGGQDKPGVLAVQDFSHIKPTPSPNWKMFDTNSIMPQWPLEVLETENEVAEQLASLLPPKAPVN